jgi:hypothetical protein
MDPLLHSAQFTKVGEEYAFWDQLQLGIQEWHQELKCIILRRIPTWNQRI